MALVKILRTVRQQRARSALRKVAKIAPVYFAGIVFWRACRCRGCERLMIFLADRHGSAESRSCLFCSANERYELLATEIRQRFGDRFAGNEYLGVGPEVSAEGLNIWNT